MRKQITKMLMLTALLALFGWHGVAQQAEHGAFKNTIEQTSLRNGPVFHEQMDPISGGQQSCFYTDEANDIYISIGADDFVVPNGETWGIRYINFAGAYGDWTGIAVDGFNVYIFEDDEGKPGDALHAFEEHTAYNEISLDNENSAHLYELMLPSTISLEQGRYWVGIQAILDGSLSNNWYWMNCDRPGAIELEFHWKNPKGGFIGDHIDWSPASEVVLFGSFNLAFAIYGEGQENDLSMVSIVAPNTAEDLEEDEIITISFKNEGLTTITQEYQASYSINGADPITETVNLEIEPNEIVEYSFTTPADFSFAGPYTITATIIMPGDPVESNNTISRTIYNYGEVYTMPAEGTESITTCGATFTDSGGLYGEFDRYDDGILTIHPSIDGDRIRLTFLEFDASHGGFKVYDGIDTEATLLGDWKGTNSPGVLTALNPTGALTIHFKGPGWEETSGWIAFISCVTPVEDDFAMLEFTSSLATIFENNTTTLSTKIQNFGSEAFDKTVTFTANGEVIGSAETGLLNTAEIADVSIEWTPTESDNYVLTASLPEDDGAEENNSLSLEKFVYPFDALFQDFEGDYPPEGWSGWSQGTNGYSGNHRAQTMVPFGFTDTLLSPRVHVKEDAELSFYAISNMWWPGEVEVHWKEEGSDEWIFLILPELHPMQWSKVTVDMSEYTGKIGRLAFIAVVHDPNAWSGGQVSVDYILGQNISLFFDDYDLTLKEFNSDSFTNLGDDSEFTVLVRNNGLEDINANDYTIKLMAGIDNPIILKTVNGQAIDSHKEIEFTINYEFDQVGEYIVTAIIDYEADEYPVDNNTGHLVTTILPTASDINTPSELLSFTEYPMDMAYNHSLSETIYLGENIDQEGIIFGLAWEYIFATNQFNVPVRIWVGLTDQDDFVGENDWIPAGELTEVFNGTLNFYEGEQSIYIPFSTPINYNDSDKNIAIMVEKSTEDYFESNRFKSCSGGAYSKIIRGYSNPGDPFDPEGGGTATFGPYVHFIFNDNLGSMEGSVTEVDGTTIEGASVTIDQLHITTTTNAQGNYELPYIPAGSYTATADMFGYVAATEDAEITLNETTTLNFTIGEQALVSVSGKVTGADNPGVGIEGAEVNLTGYHDYSTTTNAQGEFLFENVYSEKSYELSVIFDGFATHVATVAVQDEDMVIADIVLSEAMLIPFAVVAEIKREEIEDMIISWETPTATAQHILVYDDSEFENGWAAEVGEEVWMGNLLPFEVPTTVSGFDLYWVKYTQTSTQQPMRLDIFNAEGELVVSSNEFMSQFDAWIHVEIPNMTLIGDHYAMVYWYGTPDQSTFLGWTEDNASTEHAHFLYPGGEITPLSHLIEDRGTFMIRPHAMFKDDKGNGEKALTGYDIRFGKLIDLENASTWTKLNTSAITENSFEHTDWAPANDGKYLYALKAFYTTGESELSFSNIVDYKKPEGIDTDAFDAISIYPNPAVEYVTIANSEGANLILFGMDGSVKLKTEVTSNNFNLNISNMASGNYLLVIQTNEFIKQFKLIVQ